MKIRIMIAFTAWIWDGSHVMPAKCRSIFAPWSTQRPPLWSHSDQKTATNAKMMARRPMAAQPSRLKLSRRKDFPAGGICTNFRRPAQKMKVASNINTAGTPNAGPGP